MYFDKMGFRDLLCTDSGKWFILGVFLQRFRRYPKCRKLFFFLGWEWLQIELIEVFGCQVKDTLGP